VRALFPSLFARSAWAHPATVVVGTIVQGAPLTFVPLVGLDPDSHSDGGHDS
jgi:hypothetical protein